MENTWHLEKDNYKNQNSPYLLIFDRCVSYKITNELFCYFQVTQLLLFCDLELHTEHYLK